MAKLQLTFHGVTGTLDENGIKKDPVDLKMTTGSEHSEAKCYYDVSWKKTTIVNKGNDKTPPTEKDESGKGNLGFAMNLQNVSFTKEMYKPNEIIAEVQIAPGTEINAETNTTVSYLAFIPKAELEASFSNRKVSMKCDDEEVFNDYYIHEIVPQYRSDAMYVTFKIYSPDYLLTQEDYCRSYVSKKLGSEILAEEIKNYILPYNQKEGLSIDYSHQRHLQSGSQEHIFPYLVQYNESFYSFLRRTTNRWGEFLYYEDGKLRIGYTGENADKKIKMDKRDAVTYCDLTKNLVKQQNVGKYDPEAPIDKQILDNKLEKGKYDIVKGKIDSIGNKEKSPDLYWTSLIASFLNNDKTVYTYLINQGVDDLIALYQAKVDSDKKNKTFDDKYFKVKNSDVSEAKFNSEQFNGSMYNQFSEFKPILNADNYIDIVKKEFDSGRNAIVVDFDTTYPVIKLGQEFSHDGKKYLVVKVEGYQPKMMKLVKDKYFESVVDMEKVCFKITAIPESCVNSSDTTYYPSVIPEGHVKRSGAQLATISDVDDPLRQNRVRVKYSWQGGKEWSTPWLIFSTTSSTPGAGMYSRHYKDDKVIIGFVNGNVERPYVLGSVETKMPIDLKTNHIVHKTPGGQVIRMTDGRGAGLTALLASFNPGLKLIQGFFPGENLFGGFDSDINKSLEGNIELRDKYGFWSIKGSTDNRNITIKSPWGDVKISAFSGITISAPNGDVKIQGKNVSIEAGNNLTLSSGKNIKQKWWMDGEDYNAVTLATTITKMVTSKIASLLVNVTDISLLRHIVEVFLKPVEGKIQISAGRYMMLEAGGKKAGYPIDAYKQKKMDKKKEVNSNDLKCVRSFENIDQIVDNNYARHFQLYQVAKYRKLALDILINDYKVNNELQCKTVEEIVKGLWNNPDQDVETLIGFKGVFEKATADQPPKLDVIAYVKKVSKAVLAEMASYNNLKKLWDETIETQTTRRSTLITAVRRLADDIGNLKNFQVVTGLNNNDFQTLNNVVTNNDCLLKALKNKEDYKKLTAEYPENGDMKKQVRRKLFIALVNAFDIPRSATESAGVGIKATVFPEPQPDCSDEDWAKYCRSIQTLRRKEENSNWKDAVGSVLKDSFGNMLDMKNIINDIGSLSFGSSKQGEILFSSGDGTMVLDRGIYRANVGGLEDNIDDPQHPRSNGFVTRVRNAMLR